MAHVTGKFDHRHVHTETNPQKWHAIFPRVANRSNLAIDAPITESTGDQNGIQMLEQDGSLSFNLLGVNIFDVYLSQGLKARVSQRLVQRLVSISEVDVLANHAHRYLASALAELPFDHFVPLSKIGRGALQAKSLENIVIESVSAQVSGNLID